MSKIMFSSEIELGKFLGSNIDVISEAYQAISELTLPYELRTGRSGNKILAFNCNSEYTSRFLNGGFDLISSEKLQVIDFISTRVNSSFSINEAAVQLFHHLGDDLKELEKKYVNTSLIITGWGLGGYLAILSTLRLLDAIYLEELDGSRRTKRPICITFGSPIIGDVTLQRAIAERPQWNFSFLNVVAKKDPVASFFASNTPYKPLGTFLFCTESGGYTAFEDQDSILTVLHAMKLWNAGNLQIYDYTKVLSSTRRKVLYRGIFESDNFNMNSLRAGITLQLKKVGVLNDITDDDIEKMENKRIDMAKSKNAVIAYKPTKMLNDIKKSLAYMDWYIKSSKSKGGYYDNYKNEEDRSEIVSHDMIQMHQDNLNRYWKRIVDEKDGMPQKESRRFRTRWLYGGTNYRRIVEPLDIAKHYKTGNINYMEYRSYHYKLLERWSEEDKWEVKRFRAVALTEDSCFWAYVEEALVALRDLVNGGSADIEQKLEQFEAYVMYMIRHKSVSPDIFLEGSSFMKWWNEYKAEKGIAYASELAQFMNSEYKLYQ